MASIVIAGDTSGSVTLQAPAVAGSTVLNLPSTSGTIQTSGAGYTTNGVAYATSTSALSTGSALTFDGTTLGNTKNDVTGTTELLNITRNNSGTFIKLVRNAGSGNAGGLIGADSVGTYYAGSTTANMMYVDTANTNLQFYANSAEGMRLTSTGLGIGTSSPAGKLHVEGGGENAIIGSSTRKLYFRADSGGVMLGTGALQTGNSIYFNEASNYLYFSTASTERARITSSGTFVLGDTTAIGNERLYVLATTSTGYAFRLYNQQATAANTFGQFINYTASSPNGTGNQFIRCDDSTTSRFEVRSNGGIANYSANNTNLSDARTKTDIQDAGGYLAKICVIPVRTFKYKDQTDDLLNLGCIAQEVEAVAPELVDASGFGETPEDGIPLKAIYQTDLQYALMKCIQEQQALINTLTDRISVLENK